MTFGDAAADSITVTGTATFGADSTVSTDKKMQFRDTGLYINSSADGTLDIVSDSLISLNEADIYSTVTDDGTGDRKDGVVLVTGSRTSSGNPSDTQKIVDLNGTPGSNYNSWDVFTGAADNKDTIILNVDAKRINTAATGAVTDRGFNITVENQTDSSGGTLDLVGTHIKAENDGGKLQNLKAGHFELSSKGTNTIAGDSDALELQANGTVSSNTTGDTSMIKFTGEDDVDFAFNFTDSGSGGCIEDSGNLKDSGSADISCDGYVIIQTNAGTKYLALYDTTV